MLKMSQLKLHGVTLIVFVAFATYKKRLQVCWVAVFHSLVITLCLLQSHSCADSDDIEQ